MKGSQAVFLFQQPAGTKHQKPPSLLTNSCSTQKLSNKKSKSLDIHSVSQGGPEQGGKYDRVSGHVSAGSTDMPLEGMEQLLQLSFNNASLYGTLPEAWPALMPQLSALELNFNDGITGTIPPGAPLPGTPLNLPAFVSATCSMLLFSCPCSMLRASNISIRYAE